MSTYENYILTIEQQGNITKAAKKLNISQPAISTGLNSIEKKLGFSIFDRKANPVAITAEGKLYLQYLKDKQILDYNFERRLSALQRADNIEIRIGAPAAYISALLLPAISQLLKMYPNCSIKITEGKIGDLIEMVQQGILDMIISTTGQLPSGFIHDSIGSECAYLCVPANNPINHEITFDTPNIPIFPSSIWSEQFIFLGQNQPLQKRINSYLNDIGAHPHRNIEVDQITSAIRLSIDGCGISFVTDIALTANKCNPNIMLYKLPNEFFQREIYIAYMNALFLTDIHQSFISIIKKQGVMKNEDN